MAVLAAAQLLDELMGRNRNAGLNEKTTEVRWEDSELCKFYMVDFCPHDLFVNTRADLGPCPRIHDDEAKIKFTEADQLHPKKVSYMEDFMRFCQMLVNDVERRILKAKQRLQLSTMRTIETMAPENTGTAPMTPAQTQRNCEQMQLLSERINGLVEEAEKAGIDGEVEQAQGLMKLCDELKEERDRLRKQNENSHWMATAELAFSQEKQMEVCEVCGAFLIVGDAQQRIVDHLMGKQHIGYARVQSAITKTATELEQIHEAKRNRNKLQISRERSRSRNRSRNDRRRSKERDREMTGESSRKDDKYWRRDDEKERHRQRSHVHERGARDRRDRDRYNPDRNRTYGHRDRDNNRRSRNQHRH